MGECSCFRSAADTSAERKSLENRPETNFMVVKSAAPTCLCGNRNDTTRRACVQYQASGNAATDSKCEGGPLQSSRKADNRAHKDLHFLVPRTRRNEKLLLRALAITERCNDDRRRLELMEREALSILLCERAP